MGLPLNTVPVVTQSSGTNGQIWKPRKSETITCPSGQKVQVRRPGPEFTIKAQIIARTYSLKDDDSEKPEDMTWEEYGQKKLEEMSDEELAGRMIFARELVCAMLVSPKLVRNPRPVSDEIGPEDIGDDFWFLFDYAMRGFYGLKVPVGEEEVEVSDLKSFRGESDVSRSGVDSESIRPDAERPTGDQGLVGSA